MAGSSEGAWFIPSDVAAMHDDWIILFPDAEVPCEWFAYCDRMTRVAHRHPILKWVPVCERCANIANYKWPAGNGASMNTYTHHSECDEDHDYLRNVACNRKLRPMQQQLAATLGPITRMTLGELAEVCDLDSEQIMAAAEVLAAYAVAVGTTSVAVFIQAKDARR